MKDIREALPRAYEAIQDGQPAQQVPWICLKKVLKKPMVVD